MEKIQEFSIISYPSATIYPITMDFNFSGLLCKIKYDNEIEDIVDNPYLEYERRPKDPGIYECKVYPFKGSDIFDTFKYEVVSVKHFSELFRIVSYLMPDTGRNFRIVYFVKDENKFCDNYTLKILEQALTIYRGYFDYEVALYCTRSVKDSIPEYIKHSFDDIIEIKDDGDSTISKILLSEYKSSDKKIVYNDINFLPISPFLDLNDKKDIYIWKKELEKNSFKYNTSFFYVEDKKLGEKILNYNISHKIDLDSISTNKVIIKLSDKKRVVPINNNIFQNSLSLTDESYYGVLFNLKLMDENEETEKESSFNGILFKLIDKYINK